MGFQTITKARLPYAPNLPDWSAARASFDWASVERQLPWLGEGLINKAHACADQWLSTPRADRDAMIWLGKDGSERHVTFRQLAAESSRVANMLRRTYGLKKGERVFFFMDRVPELYFGLLGALKCGAVVGPLFAAFGPDALVDRLADSAARILFIQPYLLPRLDEIRGQLPALKHVIIVDRAGTHRAALRSGESLFEQAVAGASESFEIERTSREDYSIMHYTSGTTGKPKGVAHVHNAIIGQYWTARICLELKPTDIYWCTADPGWVTGTSYGIFGPWSNGITQVVWEGGFDADTWYRILQQQKVTVWYTAPTAIRMLMKAGDDVPRKYDLSSLRFCASVGEPLNPEAVVWGHRVLGQVFHDNWWQTETGCIQISNYACQDVRPGSMGRPIPGTEAGIVDDEGRPVPDGTEGNLCLKPGWPSMFRTYWNKQSQYESRFKNGWYFSGDRARRDKDGYFWFVGRADDVINTAGHLVGPFEVESALVEHPAVAEAGVIGVPDQERMEVVKAFVSLKKGFQPSDALKTEIAQFVKHRLAAHAYPRHIDFVDGLPKTRSGKIMRRLLKARELGLPEGDTSTLED